MKFLIAHKTEPNLWVQVLSHPGEITRLKLDACSKKEWTYVDEVQQATVFTESLVEYALRMFCSSCLQWLTYRPLRGIEYDVLRIDDSDTLSL